MKSKSNVLEYLAEAAKRRPGDTAVVDEFGNYTYKQLQDDSAAYGAALSEYDVANRGVVIMVEKCYDTLAIMLGTLFASGYYVPVDPSVPPVRLAHIVAALGSPLLVADEEALRGLQLEDACEIVSLEELHSQRAGIQQRDAVEPASLSIDPAYVLFTSGSTGVPKGVVVSHGAIISFIDEFVSEFEFDRSDRFANQAPFDFDVSVKDIFGSLAVGATLVIVPRRLFMQPKALVEFLDEQRVTVMVWAVAALCMVNTFRAITSDSLTTVRKVLFSGEVMPLAHLKSLLASLPDAEFVTCTAQPRSPATACTIASTARKTAPPSFPWEKHSGTAKSWRSTRRDGASSSRARKARSSCEDPRWRWDISAIEKRRKRRLRPIPSIPFTASACTARETARC